MPLQGIGLTTKFNLLSIMLVLLTATAITSYEIKKKWDNHLDAIVEHGQEMTEIVAKFSEYALFSEDEESLQSIINSTYNKETSYVGLLRSDKTVLAERGSRSDDKLFPVYNLSTNNSTHIFSHDNKHILFLVPITSSQKSALDELSVDDGCLL